MSSKQRKSQAQPQWYICLFRKRPRDAEKCWDEEIAPGLSPFQKQHLAETLFGYIWSELGPKAALNQLMKGQDLLHLAQFRFEQGCYMWTQKQWDVALTELTKSLEIQQTLGEWCHKEMQVQILYALGIVYMGMNQYEKALTEFRHAWRVGWLDLGPTNILTQSAEYMIDKVLAKQKYGTLEQKQEVSLLRQAIVHEKKGDCHRKDREYEMALAEYHQSLLGYHKLQEQPHQAAEIEQAALHGKMASIMELQDKTAAATSEWIITLSLYQAALGNHHPKTVHAMNQVISNHTRSIGTKKPTECQAK